MATRKPLTREFLLLLLQTRTQSQLAKELNIGVRTIRRIKNEEGHRTLQRVRGSVEDKARAEHKTLTRPTAKKLREVAEKQLQKAQRALQKKLDSRVSRMRKKGVSEKKIATFIRHHKQSSIPKKMRGYSKVTIPKRLLVIPPYELMTRLDPADPSLKRRMWTGVISFDVRKLTLDQITAILDSYSRLRTSHDYSLVYRIPQGGSDYRGQRFVKAGNSGTVWETLRGSDFLNVIQHELKRQDTSRKPHRFLYLKIQRTPTPRTYR